MDIDHGQSGDFIVVGALRWLDQTSLARSDEPCSRRRNRGPNKGSAIDHGHLLPSRRSAILATEESLQSGHGGELPSISDLGPKRISAPLAVLPSNGLFR